MAHFDKFSLQFICLPSNFDYSRSRRKKEAVVPLFVRFCRIGIAHNKKDDQTRHCKSWNKAAKCRQDQGVSEHFYFLLKALLGYSGWDEAEPDRILTDDQGYGDVGSRERRYSYAQYGLRLLLTCHDWDG